MRKLIIQHSAHSLSNMQKVNPRIVGRVKRRKDMERKRKRNENNLFQVFNETIILGK